LYLSKVLMGAKKDEKNPRKEEKNLVLSAPTPLVGSAAAGSASEEYVDLGEIKENAWRAAAVRKLMQLPLRVSRAKGLGAGKKEGVMSSILTYNSAIQSDASGNAPYFLNTALMLVGSQAWTVYTAIYDIVRVVKVSVQLNPKYGFKNVVTLTPLTAASNPVFRVATDPDGAVSAPSVTQMNGFSVGNPHSAPRDFDAREGGTYKMPDMPMVLRQGAADLTRRTLWKEWADVGDVTNNAAQFVGGIIANGIGSGSFPATAQLFGITIYVTAEFSTATV